MYTWQTIDNGNTHKVEIGPGVKLEIRRSTHDRFYMAYIYVWGDVKRLGDVGGWSCSSHEKHGGARNGEALERAKWRALHLAAAKLAELEAARDRLREALEAESAEPDGVLCWRAGKRAGDRLVAVQITEADAVALGCDEVTITISRTKHEQETHRITLTSPTGEVLARETLPGASVAVATHYAEDRLDTLIDAAIRERRANSFIGNR